METAHRINEKQWTKNQAMCNHRLVTHSSSSSTASNGELAAPTSPTLRTDKPRRQTPACQKLPEDPTLDDDSAETQADSQAQQCGATGQFQTQNQNYETKNRSKTHTPQQQQVNGQPTHPTTPPVTPDAKTSTIQSPCPLRSNDKQKNPTKSTIADTVKQSAKTFASIAKPLKQRPPTPEGAVSKQATPELLLKTSTVKAKEDLNTPDDRNHKNNNNSSISKKPERKSLSASCVVDSTLWHGSKFQVGRQ